MNAALAFGQSFTPLGEHREASALRAVPCFDDDSGLTTLPAFDDETVVTPYALELDEQDDGSVCTSTVVSIATPMAERSRREVHRIEALSGPPAFKAVLVGRAAGSAVLEVSTVASVRVAVSTLSPGQCALLDVLIDRDGRLTAWVDGKLAFQTHVEPVRSVG